MFDVISRFCNISSFTFRLVETGNNNKPLVSQHRTSNPEPRTFLPFRQKTCLGLNLQNYRLIKF